MNDRLSLSELQAVIRDSLYLSMPDMYWVVGEISEIKENFAGHCYLELIEKSADDKNIRARIRAIIWNSKYRLLSSFFSNCTGESLRNGIRILFRAKIEYHEVYGLSLIISDIDPSYTLGEMAIKRQMIIKKLEDEGIFNMNKELDFPELPSRIAIISSATAAGYTDFIKHLHSNHRKYTFQTRLYESVMQGEDTEQSVISALEAISGDLDSFDLVAIIRGGGSQSDLSWFDNYNIAYYITQFPLPVITGIGHDKDISVTDMVAWRSFKTPTAAADHLIECMSDAENRLRELAQMIAEVAGSIIEEKQIILNNNKSKLIPIARLHISSRKEILSNVLLELVSKGKESVIRAGYIPVQQSSALKRAVSDYLKTLNSKINTFRDALITRARSAVSLSLERAISLEKAIKASDPANILSKGYSITTLDGKVVKSARQLTEGKIIETILSEGKVSSTINSTVKK